MGTPEQFRRDDKPESADEEQLKQLEEAAAAARIAGVYDPSDEGER